MQRNPFLTSQTHCSIENESSVINIVPNIGLAIFDAGVSGELIIFNAFMHSGL